MGSVFTQIIAIMWNYDDYVYPYVYTKKKIKDLIDKELNKRAKEANIEMKKREMKAKVQNKPKKKAKKPVIKKPIKKELKVVIEKKKSAREYRDKKHIGVFKEFWWNVVECQKCGGTKWGLQVHHINKKAKDNHPFNLIKLCLVCHCKAHKWDMIYHLMKSRLDFVLNK